MRTLTDELGIRLPIIQAPMAGGPDTLALAAAVSNAGGLGSLGCAYLTAAQIAERASELGRLTARPFGLNLFIRDDQRSPSEPPPAHCLSVLLEIRLGLGLPPEPSPVAAADSFEAQLEAVLSARPRLFSFTFGMPAREALAALRGRGIFTVGTATSVAEGEALADLGVDAICAQGSEAGGHRGTFLGRFEDARVGTMALVPQLARKLRLPIIAAGGIMDGQAIRAALTLGAQAVQLGTAFMNCPEAGTHPAHRAALASEAARRTVVTRAFSGRPARGIRNRFTDLFEAVAPSPFPVQQRLTADIRAAAAARGRTDLMQMWAGQAAPLIRALPAGELVAALAREAGLG